MVLCLPGASPQGQETDGVDSIPRDPLEIQALTQPADVLKRLPALLAEASRVGDHRRQALLEVARANACRVIADWDCQRRAGQLAADAARLAGDPVLQVRGLIAQSRGNVSLQDYSRGEHLLGEAELILREHPLPALSADVYLAYSSLSFVLGKQTLAADYARRGLAVLAKDEAVPMQVRLLRNLARAQSQSGRRAEARQALVRAQALIDRFDDPKLEAELYIELARLAHADHDFRTEDSAGKRILALAARLENSQLSGLAHEVLGFAAIDHGDALAGEQEMQSALDSFHGLGLENDEFRVLRQLLQMQVARNAPKETVRPRLVRFLALGERIDREARAKASEDFDARVKYAASEVELVRLKDQAMMAEQRTAALQQTNRLIRLLAILSIASIVVLGVFYLLQRRSNRRLGQALARERESELRYRMLAENSRDLVVRMQADGKRVYVSPSAREMIGWDASELKEPRWELVHPDDLDNLREVLSKLLSEGGVARTSFRVRHKDGHYLWLEAMARRVDGVAGSAPEIVYSARDISAQKSLESQLAREARHDALTGTANRRFFEERLATALARSKRLRTPITVLYLDVDHFKRINDQLGHAVGDAVIREFAARLSRCVREVDLVARLGGDEFAILVEDAASPDIGEMIASKICESMRAPILADGRKIEATTSVGVAFARVPQRAEAVLASADEALYAAKNAGRNTWRVLVQD